jgi:hypothetical protein
MMLYMIRLPRAWSDNVTLCLARAQAGGGVRGWVGGNMHRASVPLADRRSPERRGSASGTGAIPQIGMAGWPWKVRISPRSEWRDGLGRFGPAQDRNGGMALEGSDQPKIGMAGSSWKVRTSPRSEWRDRLGRLGSAQDGNCGIGWQGSAWPKIAIMGSDVKGRLGPRSQLWDRMARFGSAQDGNCGIAWQDSARPKMAIVGSPGKIRIGQSYQWRIGAWLCVSEACPS